MNSFSISGFKAFEKKQNIPIKPITIIYGANSAGKSSIIQSYLLVNHILKTLKCDVNIIKTGWDSLDIGGFKQYCYKHNYENEIEFVVNLEEDNLQLKINIKAETDKFGNLIDKEAFINSFEIYAENDSLIKMSSINNPDNNLFRISTLNTEHDSWKNIFNQSIPNKEDISKTDLKLYSFDLKQFINGMSETNVSNEFFSTCFNLKGVKKLHLINQNTTDDFINFFVKIFVKIWTSKYNYSLGKSDESLRRINYIGPLRDYPPRVISDEPKSDEDAEYTWSILLKNKKVRDKVNKWLGNTILMDPAYELIVERAVKPESFLLPFLNLLSEVDVNMGHIPEELSSILQLEMDYDEEGPAGYYLSPDSYSSEGASELIDKLLENQKDKESYSKLILKDKRAKISVSLRDVGVGISQVLPVLVNAYSPDNNIVAIEQPEIHLHPKLQSELADVFIETALGEEKKTFLIETHSEHLLLRIMRRIRETTNNELEKGLTSITADDVQILFVMPSQNGEGSIVKEIALDEEGEMIDTWPGGFFEEGFNERFSL